MRLSGILINRKDPVPLHRQLESALREAILSGRLAPGERLLSSRDFQQHLGVSRNTVLEALGQLLAEGYLISARGVGTFVAPNVQQLPPDRSERIAPPSIPSEGAAQFLALAPLAANLQQTAPFRPGVPALDLFPSAQFRRGLAPSAWTPELLDYDRPFGHAALRAAISQRLKQTRGIVCSADDVLVAGGAQAAFSLIARVLLNKGDVAIVEDPGYANVRAALLAEGARVFGAPVDDAGIRVAPFQRRRAKLVCVTPSHQYPSGAVLSLGRRFALLDWAAKHDAWIVEDDYDSEFNYTNRPQPALQGLGGGGRVIYVGTFSKVLSPAVRVAYVVVPQSLRSAFSAAHSITGGAPSAILQACLARFIEAGHLGRHVAKMRAIYDERRGFAHDELGKLAGGNLFDIRDSRAGLHFVAELPKGVSDVALSERALRRGIILPALSTYYHDNPPRNGVLIGYAAASIAQSRAAIRTLAEILQPGYS